MNIDLCIKFNTVPVNGQSTEYKVKASLMLYPFFCTEADVVDPFNVTVKDEEKEFVRQIIFNSSISVLRLTSKLRMLKVLTQDEMFRLERDLTICMATHQLAIKVNQNAIESYSRSKSLGDFSVATTKRNNPQFIAKLISDSESCVHELKELIKLMEQDRVLPKFFIKSVQNITSTRSSARLWWPKEMFPFTRDSFASWKQPVNGGLYKKATFGYLYGSALMAGMPPMYGGNAYLYNNLAPLAPLGISGPIYNFMGYDYNYFAPYNFNTYYNTYYGNTGASFPGDVYLATEAGIRPLKRDF